MSSKGSFTSNDTPPDMPGSIKRKLINVLPLYFALAVTWTHVLLSPYTKVEESFTLHAVHDVLAYGPRFNSIPHWDHITFPGAVPRSFVPPILLGTLAYPLSALGVWLGWIKIKIDVQILVRLVLAIVFSASFHHLAATISFRFGSKVRWWFVALALSSFHIPYYAGRTIPNFLALPVVMVSISFILRSAGLSIPVKIKTRRMRNAIVLLTAVSTIVRLEIALFLLPVTLSCVMRGRLLVKDALVYGLMGGLGSLLISAPIDYFLWRPTLSHPDFPFTSPSQIIWPELSGLIFNFFNDKASDWGVMSRHFYITNSLPKLLVGTAAPIAVGGLMWLMSFMGYGGKWLRGTGRSVGEVVYTFGPGVIGLVGGMSMIGHKEWRFIVYCAPVLVLIASIAAAGLWDLPSTRLRPLARLGLIGILTANVAFTGVSTFLSIHNYPGGQVWRALEELPLNNATGESTIVHFTTYPLQTGASLFTFLHADSTSTSAALPSPQKPVWVYDKSEDEILVTPAGYKEAGETWDVLVTDDWRSWEGQGWKTVSAIKGFAGFYIDRERGNIPVPRLRKDDKLAVLIPSHP